MPNSATPMVVVERGEVGEGIHQGHLAASNPEGGIVAAAGDPRRLTYFRSCAKPFQAIANMRTGIVERFALSSQYARIIIATHKGKPRHGAVARDFFPHAGVDESALHSGAHGPYNEPAANAARRELAEPIAVFNNCSG